MKKLLSIILAVSMLMGLLVSLPAQAVDAVAITGLDTKRLEFEDFATGFLGADGTAVGGNGWIVSHSLLSDGKGLLTGSGPMQDISLTIPLEVKIGGTFSVETVISYASWLSTLTLFLDGNPVLVADGSGTALPHSEDGYYFNSSDFPGYQYQFDLDIPSGNHELKLHVKQRAENFNGGDTAFAADYIQFTNLSAVSAAEITREKPVQIEVEDYKGNVLSGGAGYTGVDIVENAKASGGKVFSITEKEIPGATVLIPVQVSETGVYDLQTIMSRNFDDWTSIVTLTVDGEKVLDNRNYHRENLSDLELETPFVNSNYPMHAYRGRVALSAGGHTIQFEAAPAVQDSKVKFMVDCLTVTPAKAESVSAEKETTLEFEDYAGKFNSMYAIALGKDAKDAQGVACANRASGGDYAYSYGAGSDNVVFYLPIEVEKTGVYNVEYVAAYASHLSRTDIYLDDAKAPFQTNISGGEALDTEESGYFHSKADIPAKKFTFPMYLTEGSHYLKFDIPPRPAGDSMSVAFAADYIRFTKDAGVAVSAETGATIEMEAYVDKILADGDVLGNGNTYAGMKYTAGVNASEYASGGKFLNMAERTKLTHATIQIPVFAEEDGWYDVDWTVTNASGGTHLSHTTLYLDGKYLVMNNGESMKEDVSVYEDGNEGNVGSVIYPAKWYPQGRYEAQIQLTAGEHILTVDAEQIKVLTDGGYGVKFYTDAITLTPIHGILGSGASFTESADHTGGTWSFDMIAAGLSGTLYGYIASYSGNRLVDVVIEPLSYVSGENKFTGTVPAGVGVDKMKFFVWDANGMPYAKENEVTFMEINEEPFAGDDEINVVFIGDSIYEGAGATPGNRWTDRVSNWFKATYEKDGVTVNCYNEGVGGSTTDYSLVRMFRDVIDHNPDVVFFSCSCNDIGDTRRNMESFLLTLMEQDQVPYVIFNRTTNRGFSTTNGYGNQIAAHYNIPFVDDYAAFKRAVAESGKGIADFFTDDGVHPNDSGYKVIADEMIACLSSGRYYHKPVSDGTKVIANSITLENADFMSSQSDAITKMGSWTSDGSTGERAYMHSTQVGDTLEFTFTGNMLAFEHGLHDPAGKYEVYVDDQLAMTCNPQYNGITTYFHFVCKADTVNLDLPDGEHTVRVVTVPGDKTTDETYAVRIFNIITGNVIR